jgi:hypothetical protein
VRIFVTFGSQFANPCFFTNLASSSFFITLPYLLTVSYPSWFTSFAGYLLDSKQFNETAEQYWSQWLGEHICDHIVGWAVSNLDLILLDLLLDEQVAHVDVLGPIAVVRVVGESDAGLIIFLDLHWLLISIELLD